MAATAITKGQFLFKTGEPVTSLYLILKGTFSVTFPGGSYTLGKGEAPGICEADADLHDMTCQALEDASVLVCPINGLASLEPLFKEIADYAMLFTRSAFRQVNRLLELHELTELACSNLSSSCAQDYAVYSACCIRHQVNPRRLTALDALPPFSEDCPTATWAATYYDGFQRLLSSQGSAVLAKEPAVLTGLIAGICADCHTILPALENLADYQKQVLLLYLNSDIEDLFDFYTSLYLKLGADSSDAENLYTAVRRMVRQLKESPYTDKALFAQRVADFESGIRSMAPAGHKDAGAGAENVSEQLTGSLQTILDYSGADEETLAKFKKLIMQYKAVADKNDTDDTTRSLRLNITQNFYTIYKHSFFRAAKDTDIPLPVRMFLYFGYVDEQLAGEENAACLARMAKILAENPREHVYTLYDWLLAILKGKKEPCRNEFDQDYTDHLHALKVSGQIDANKEAQLLKDMAQKVEYELTNMFPVVNKMTFGRISTFCPVFSAHNVLKNLDASFVSEQALTDILDSIETMDYSAFYREYVYTNQQAGIPKEFLHMRILPDILLTPCVGTRGVMWQEIEGRRRTTAARMMLPIFYLEDLRSAVVRLTGEYRWEMCKRVQGARWNDLSERSLTSEYFDYIQFYRKNHDLSAETKDKIKTALQKAHNSFKEMFVRDYITYILYEGTGSPRLTKPARTILFHYCPFAKQTRQTLSGNPIYKDMLEHYTMVQNQQLHKLDLLEKRAENSGCPIPEDLEQERDYLLK